jgi:heme O synthase-like polyprenyltransferase
VDQSARLSFTWMAATACSSGLLPGFGAVATRPATAALVLASLWLVWKAAALLRRAPDEALFRRTFWCINLFAMVVMLAVMVDPFLPG